MAHFIIIHNENPNKSWLKADSPNLNDVVRCKDAWKVVALLKGGNVEDAFRDTNHIDCAWWENRSIIAHKEARSTSVGDIVVNLEDGNASQVDGCGWVDLGVLTVDARIELKGRL